MAKSLAERVAALEHAVDRHAEGMMHLQGLISAHKLAIALIADVACGKETKAIDELMSNLRTAESVARRQNENDAVMRELRALRNLLRPDGAPGEGS